MLVTLHEMAPAARTEALRLLRRKTGIGEAGLIAWRPGSETLRDYRLLLES